MADDFDYEAYADQYLRETGGRRSVTNPVTVPSPSPLKFAFDIVKQKQTPPLGEQGEFRPKQQTSIFGDPEDGDTGGEADRDVLEDLIADEYGLPPVEIPQSQADAIRGYFEAVEPLITAEGGRGQATTKPEPKPPTKSGYARVTAGERETYFAPWETEGMTDEELMQIGAHPSQKKTLPPMDTTREHTVAEVRKGAEAWYANEGGFDFSTVDTSATREKIAGLDRAAKDANLADTNTDIYKEHLPEELHNNPDALREAAKDAAAENYFNMMEKHGSEQGWADVEIDGEPWKETWFKDGETFFVSEDESQILRAPDAQKS